MKKLFLFGLFVSIGLFYACEKQVVKEENVAHTTYVNPIIGTGGHGHTYPGATVPFGMIQLSPDNGISAWDWCSGYNYVDSLIAGFSHLHLSGTGIGDLADILVMPTTKDIDLTTVVKKRDDIPYLSKYSHKKEVAEAGYYSLYLDTPKILAELTATQRLGLHRYTFEKNATQSLIIDLGFAINWDKPTDTKITIEDAKTVTGHRYSKGWAKNQKVFFVAKFSKPIKEQNIVANGKLLAEAKEAEGERVATQLYFENDNNEQLLVQVAISSVSIENAKLNLEKEKTTFDIARSQASNLWEQGLSNIEVKTSVDSLKTIFYTAMYHAMVAPVTFSDVNGEWRREDDKIMKSDHTMYSTLSLWDTFRTEHPLLNFIAPERVADMINSMLEYYETNKILPVWTLYGNETNTMTGYHSVPVIAEAYLKGIRGFDVEKAYEAMRTTMMQDDRGLNLYKKYGFIPYDKIDESVTITLEYAYDDYAVAQLAKALGKMEDYTFFSQRAEAYKHLFDKSTGFMRGKKSDGKTWNSPFDPKHSNHREHTDYTEGNAWQHSWFVLHDPKALIDLHGGNKPFLAKLEQLYAESSDITGDNVSVDISGLIGQYAHGNEPSHHIAYLFNFAGEPWRTQFWVREILKSQYFTTPEGLSGNEDCGQMSAWYVMSAIGFYPFNTVNATYQIGSPIFDEVKLNLHNGKTFTIIAENTSDTNRYIQSATLNGKTFNRTLITHKEIMAGGELKFVMGATPNKLWGVEK